MFIDPQIHEKGNVVNKSSLILKSALALALATPLLASAESQLVTGAGAASARLDFRVVIPRVLYLAVGTGNAALANNSTVDLLTFDYSGNAAGVGTGTDSAAQGVTVRVLGNSGQISLAAAGSGAGLTNGTDVIAWSEILASSTDATNLAVPAVGGASAPVLNTARVTSRTATWNYAYSNTDVVAPGIYNGQITYTATAP